ncbi:NAD(P)/FAD-dependent oxidoreductase [Halapricum hydrolyticum]|uniref:NAD(P)/FAD-dependent oxidoreductase n=1 Tax=Halapricum hydrolyticum TaxID=2979991 RepID=A0AAE3LJM9_9EURY|nr:NAD(P)/FAD-dependent oxidoreductase [Halapricum hydrolyticum]MCU4718478.1 NAD(P)/FAD-dependent oxidoreductase [Halapricum hydrolyticum]MCU4727503.1 NAD(P)/FAD-dependent oxidoreductase [Halapricum hydrolyticum]
MAAHVVVLGSGYAGAGAIKSLEDELRGQADITWISEVDYHLVLHEVHRCISDPTVQEKITIPVEEIKSPSTRFVEGHVENVDVDGREVELADERTIDYDYLLVAIGSETAFFGLDGLKKHAHTLKSLDDALGIHDAIRDAAREASHDDPARVIVGGAGLSGIQAAGEIARFRDEVDAPLDVVLVEALDSILPNSDSELQEALRRRLKERNVRMKTGEFIRAADEDSVTVGDERVGYDVLVWTGGITGRKEMANVDLEKDHDSNRVKVETTFQADDDRVFAIGDAALVEQPSGEPVPPNAQAAWDAAEVAGENVARAIRGQPLQAWTYKDKGTAISIGEDAVAHDVLNIPISTFDGFPARLLKKAIAVRWIADITSPSRAIAAWGDM